MTVTTAADYTEKIPNNVSLHEDRRLQRALESWQLNFLNWWQTMGLALPTQDVYLRAAVNVGREGWAQFGHVPMPEYRWGIFLAERDPGLRVGFGEHKGEPVWDKAYGATLFFAGPTFFANMLRADLPADALAGVRLAASAGRHCRPHCTRDGRRTSAWTSSTASA